MGWTDWTDLVPFTDHFQIRQYVGHTLRRRDWQTTLEENSDYLSTAEGLWPVAGGKFDFEDTDVIPDVSKIPVGVYFIRIEGGENHTKSGFFDYIGMAEPHKDPNPRKFQVGIFQRAYDHYRKIVGIPHRGNIGRLISKGYPDLHERSERVKKFKDQNFRNYEELREFFDNCDRDGKIQDIPNQFRNLTEVFRDELKTFEDIKKFFGTKVRFSYNLYSGASGANAAKQIAKAEGLALLAYKNKYKEIPYLNDANELKSLERFNEII